MFLEAHSEDGAGCGSPGESHDLPGDPGRELSVQQVFALPPLPLLEGEEGDPACGLTGS